MILEWLGGSFALGRLNSDTLKSRSILEDHYINLEHEDIASCILHPRWYEGEYGVVTSGYTHLKRELQRHSRTCRTTL